MRGTRICNHIRINVDKLKKDDCLGWIDPKTKQWVYVWDIPQQNTEQ